MSAEQAFLVLFVVAITVAVVAQRLRLPYTAALVLAGLLLGSLHVLNPPHLTQSLLFNIVLPGLLFEAAYHIDFRAFWRERGTIFLLAVPGVAAAITLTTIFLTRLFGAVGVGGIGWEDALLFAAVVAATDPVAVVALFKKLSAPPRLTLLLEGESLLNDGTAIVFFTLVLSLVSGGTWSAGALAVDFGLVVGAGLLIGSVVGMAATLVTQRIDDPMIEITITTIAAYGSFVLAEQFHYSGVIATVTAGMICGNYAARTGMSPSTRVAAEVFWEYIVFALNSVVFLLIGFEVSISSLVASWLPILLAYLAVTGARAGVILAVAAWRGRGPDRLPRRWSVVLVWGGLRGALSMVLALSLPESPHRSLLVTVTFGVVLLSILVQGITMAPLLRWLGIVRLSEAHLEYEVLRGRLQTASAALGELDRMQQGHAVSDDVADTVRKDYRAALDRASAEMRDLHVHGEALRKSELQGARRRLLLVEKQQLIDEHSHGSLGEEAYERLLADVDARLIKVESGEDSEDVAEPPASSAEHDERPPDDAPPTRP